MRQIENIIDLTVGEIDARLSNFTRFHEVVHPKWHSELYLDFSWDKVTRLDPWTIHQYNDAEERKYIIIRHLHEKSELACATTWIDRLQWACCVCLEEVPKGILFMARTMRLEG